MGKSVGIRKMAGFLFTSITGTLLHFLFDISGGNWAAGLVSAVNESIWEHMKLIYVPMIIFSILEWRFAGKDIPGFWRVKLRGILLALAVIPALYYIYTGILGVSADWFNITIFFLAAGAAYRYEAKAEGRNCVFGKKAAVVLILLIGLIFAALTFWPPRIPLFRDPVNGSFGFFGSR